MRIAHLEKLSLIDYDNKISSVIFTYGCNLRCPFCHNPQLVTGEVSFIKPEDVLNILKSRKRFVRAVVITGGEPLLQKNLESFLVQLKELQFDIKLDTNGTFPAKLKNIIKKRLVDYIALDLKAKLSLRQYQKAAGVKLDVNLIKEAALAIRDSGLDYEFRTTAIKELIAPQDIEYNLNVLKPVRRFCLQTFMPHNTLRKRARTYTPYSEAEFRFLQKTLEKYTEKGIILR